MKLDCREAERFLSARIDGELGGGPEAQTLAAHLAAHLAACPACRNVEREEMERSRLLSGALAGGGVPPSLVDSVLEELRESAATRGRGDRRNAFALGGFLSTPWARIAALALVTVAGVWLAVAWWGGDPKASPGLVGTRDTVEREPGPVGSPSAARVSRPTAPLRFVFEDERWDPEIRSDAQGSLWKRQVRTRHNILLDPAERVGSDAAGESDLLLDLEHRDTRYVKLTGWTYH
jgi:hypothetical protein